MGLRIKIYSFDVNLTALVHFRREIIETFIKNSPLSRAGCCFTRSLTIYDDLGNPLHYRDGMEFEWTRGRLLDKATVNNTEIQMYYDSNGLRTQKGDIYYYYDSESKLIALKKNALTMFFYYDSSDNPIAFSYNGCIFRTAETLVK